MQSKYYNGARLLNAKCPINLSVGNRSTGKSYYWKRYCVKQFIKHGRKFMYLRRYVTDMTLAMEKFFEDISHEFPNNSMEIKCDKFILHTHDKITGKIIDTHVCGYGFALSIIHKIKSIPVEDVDTIFFDEFIPDNSRYLKPNEPGYEPQLLLSLYMTVARGYEQVIRDNVRIICVANAISFYNPYFSFFGVDLTKQERCIYNNVYAERFHNETISDEIRKSKIGAILEGTLYGAMALDNKGMYDSDTHIVKHPKNSYPLFCIYFNNWYTCWLSRDGNAYFSKSYDKTMKFKYKIVEVPNSDDEIPWLKDNFVEMLRVLAYQDKLYYDTGAIKANLHGLFIPKRI